MALRKFSVLSLLLLLMLPLASLAEPPSLSHFQSKIDGPNCHNTGLVFNRMISVRRYVPRQEMEVWLKNFCEVLPRGSEIATGDLRIWRKRQENKEPMLWHTQIILDRENVFEKLGYMAMDAYRLDKYKLQGRSSAGGAKWTDAKRTLSCGWANGIPEDCYLYVTYYRCDQERYANLVNQNRALIEELFGSDFLLQLSQLEETADGFAANYFNTKLANEIVEAATALRARLDHKNNVRIDPALLETFKLRLDGMILTMQLEPIDLNREKPIIEL